MVFFLRVRPFRVRSKLDRHTTITDALEQSPELRAGNYHDSNLNEAVVWCTDPFMTSGIKEIAHADLPLVAQAFGGFGLLLGPRQCGQQHRGQNRNDGNNHQQLDQRESYDSAILFQQIIAWHKLLFGGVHPHSLRMTISSCLAHLSTFLREAKVLEQLDCGWYQSNEPSL